MKHPRGRAFLEARLPGVRPHTGSLREWVLLLVKAEREHADLSIQREREARAALEALISAQFKAQERALVVAAEAMTIRLDHSNNLIAAAREKENEYARKSEMLAAIVELERRLSAMEQYRAAREGQREGGQPMFSILMLVVGAVVTGLVGLTLLKLAS